MADELRMTDKMAGGGYILDCFTKCSFLYN